MKQTKKNILYIRTDLGTKDLVGGGSVAHTLGVIKGLLEQGHVVICASSAMHAALAQIQHDNFIFIPLSMPYISSLFGFKIQCLLSNLYFYYKAEKIIKAYVVDVMYQRYSMLNVVGAWLKQYYCIPLFLEFNGSEVWVDAHWSPSRLRLTRLMNKIEQHNLDHADEIFVVSDVLKKQLIDRKINPDKIHVNPNGVDTALFDPALLTKDRAVVREKLQLHTTYVIGFSGTFSYWHGIDVLAYVIPRVVKKEKNIHFLLIGDGPLKQQLEHTLHSEQVSSNVTFTGMLDAQLMPAYLAACDAYICPTQPNKDGTPFFGSPTKLFEYMAMGKPIIASHIEQIGDVLSVPDMNNLLIPHYDYEAFVQAIIGLVHMDGAQYEQIGIALQRKVQQYTWQTHAQHIIDNQ